MEYHMWHYILTTIITLSLLCCCNTYVQQGILIEDSVPIVFSNARPSPGATTDVRFIAVYLPYEATINPTARFPVVYYLPGLGGDQNTFADANAEIMDELINQKKIAPFIVVNVDPSLINGINPDGERTYEGTWYINSTLNGTFEDFFVRDLVPYIDTHYPTKPDKAFRALAGQSMGGFGALILGTKHPELFCGMGSASGTPFWAIITNLVPDLVPVGSINPPGDTMFAANSLILPEIPDVGPNTGKITPDNGPFTFSFFSYSGALSSNTNNPPFFVNLPFEVDQENNPIFTEGSFIIASPETGQRFSVPISLTPRQEIIDQWKTESPYILAIASKDTLKRQAIYLDGGNVELINAAGARQLSDRYVSLNIDHEYILYFGDHTTCLIEESCSRNQTMFQYMSSKFAEGGLFTDEIRVSIIGKGTIELHDDVTLAITDQHIIAVETDRNLNIQNTNITFELFDNATIKIGSSVIVEKPQGALQIGNSYTKVSLRNDPTLASDTVACTFIMRSGSIEIQPSGFLGIGVGVNGFASQNLNEWSLTTLTNINNISLQLISGSFRHEEQSNQDLQRSLIAFGPSNRYDFYINPAKTTMFGGGSTITLADGFWVQPVASQSVGEQMPGGIRNDADLDKQATDYFYDAPIGSLIYYENSYQYGILANSFQLPISGINHPFAFQTRSLDEYFSRLSLFTEETYNNVYGHEGIIIINDANQVEISALDNNGTIQRFVNDQIPNFSETESALRRIAQSRGSVDIIGLIVNGIFRLIRVDNVI